MKQAKILGSRGYLDYLMSYSVRIFEAIMGIYSRLSVSLIKYINNSRLPIYSLLAVEE